MSTELSPEEEIPMARTLIIEVESGTCTGSRHHHNGYYAGDFSTRPIPTDLTALSRRQGSW
jgi:hypothetical protein